MSNQPFEVAGSTMYQLEFDGYGRGGKEVMRNRIYATVYGHRDTPQKELENTAKLFSESLDLLEALKEIASGVFCDLKSVEEYARAVIAKTEREE